MINYVTIEDLCKQWIASPEWKQYSEGTKMGETGRMKEAMEVPLPGKTLKFGDLNYTLLRKRHIYQLRQYKYEEGTTEYQLMAVMGWTNPAQAMKYIEAARRRKMATGAYDKLQAEQNKDKEK